MTTLIRSYALGLRTLRGTYGVAAALVALVALTVGADLAANAGNASYTTPGQLREPVVAGVGILAAVGLSLLAAARVGGEFRHRTITLRFLAGPRRTSILAAALITYGAFSLLVGAASLGVGIGIAQPIVAAEGLSLGLSASLIGAVLLAVVLFTLIGVCAGAICRNQPAAVLVVAGAFVGEKLAGMAIGDAAAYLPYALLTPLLGMEGATISRGTAALTLAAVTGGLCTLAAYLVAHRDVT
ncbi:hypothetical protein [Actinomadura sp. 6N118]|uniref:hypothetical protein n=1 Tax=Actinomadura sp. 6N118 TaxID=3375151 RepID=UPI00378D5AC0